MLRECLIKACAALFVITAIGSCTSQVNSDNQARGLFEKASACYKTNPDSALRLLDALKKRYPDSVFLQRCALHLRTQINDIVISRQIVENDSVLASESAIKQQLSPKFKWVDEKDMVEGFWVESRLGGILEQGTAFQPRIDKGNNIYIATIVSGKNLGYSTITVNCNGNSISTPSAQSYSFGGHELVTFHGEVCDSICKMLADNIGAGAMVTFAGKRSYTMSLSPEVRSAIENTYRYCRASKLVHHATGLQIYLKEKRKINQKQIEKTKL